MKIRAGMEDKYKEGYQANADPYGHAVFTFLERWADLMEKDIEEKGDPAAAIHENAEERSREADTEGISGFMYGLAVSILAQCWEYGEILRRWHNKEWGYEGKGTVNPAIMSISING